MAVRRGCRLSRVVSGGRAAPERAQKVGTTQHPTFGDFLRRYRLAAGLSQEALAEQARLSARAISDRERGARRVPRKETVELLVEVLRLPAPDQATLAAAVQRGRVSHVAPGATLYDNETSAISVSYEISNAAATTLFVVFGSFLRHVSGLKES